MKITTIGTSMITKRFIESFHLVDGVELIGVYSRSQEKAEQLKAETNAQIAFSDFDQMLESDLFDTVYVASPNTLHFEQSKAALLAGKHVICEKPFVSTPDQMIELWEIAKERELFIFEAITTLFLPNYKIVREHLNEIGDIRLINCNYSQYSSRYDLYKERVITNIFDPEFDGGALRDINIYNIHFVTGLFGYPNRSTYFPNKGYNGIDTNGIMIMEYDHFNAVCIGSKDSSSEAYGLIQGDKGTIKVSHSSLGRCAMVELLSPIMDNHVANDSQTISIEQQHHMSYELKAFKEIIDTRNFQERDRLLNHSLEVLKIMEDAKTQ